MSDPSKAKENCDTKNSVEQTLRSNNHVDKVQWPNCHIYNFDHTYYVIKYFQDKIKIQSRHSKEAKESSETPSIIVVRRGTNEEDPPLWTLANNSSQMKTAGNVITGTRITHGHPLLVG